MLRMWGGMVMRTHARRFLLLRAAGTVLLLSAPLRGTNGHQLIGIGAVQKATAGAGVASARDSTWVLLNPAAIDDLELRLDVSVEMFAPERSIEPEGPDLPALGGQPLANRDAGRSEDTSIFWIPSIGAAIPTADGTFGVGWYGVCGMGVDYHYPRTTIPGFSGQYYDYRTEYAVSKLALAYARPVGGGLTLGIALNLDMAQFRSDMLTSAFTQTKGDFERDTAFGAGFQLGFVQHLGCVAVGGTYISRQWFQEFDRYDDLLGGPLDLPQMVQLGVSWRVHPKLELLTDYKYINWSGVPALGEEPHEGGFGWDDQHVIKVWTVTPRCRLSTGYSYGRSPIDEQIVFANALFPAIVEHHATLGVSFDLTEHSSVHFTYMHAFENTLEDSGKGDMYSQAGAGTEITLVEDTFTLQYSFRF